jgi:predicted aspartyl protease
MLGDGNLLSAPLFVCKTCVVARIRVYLVRRAWIGAVLLAATCCSAAARSAEALDGSPVAETSGCSTRLLGKIVIATLNRAPFVTLAANGHSVTLIVDTGAERTVLTPEAAKAIDAQHPKIEFQRQVRGVGGDLASHEVELRSFAAGAVPIPWRRLVVASVKTAKVFQTRRFARSGCFERLRCRVRPAAAIIGALSEASLSDGGAELGWPL